MSSRSRRAHGRPSGRYTTDNRPVSTCRNSACVAVRKRLQEAQTELVTVRQQLQWLLADRPPAAAMATQSGRPKALSPLPHQSLSPGWLKTELVDAEPTAPQQPGAELEMQRWVLPLSRAHSDGPDLLPPAAPAAASASAVDTEPGSQLESQAAPTSDSDATQVAVEPMRLCLLHIRDCGTPLSDTDLQSTVAPSPLPGPSAPPCCPEPSLPVKSEPADDQQPPQDWPANEHPYREEIETEVCQAEHLQTSENVQCWQCHACFRSWRRLEQHAAVEHPGSKAHRCADCGNTFNQLKVFRQHTKSHSEARPFLCVECGAVFKDKRNLHQHKLRHTGDKPHQCTECGRGFAKMSDLVRHQRTHTGEKPHLCSECGHRFALLSALNVHQRTHTGDRPHLCAACGKAFSQIGHLRAHEMAVHRLERPYLCSHCSKRFSYASHLRKHEQSVHLKSSGTVLSTTHTSGPSQARFSGTVPSPVL